MTKNAYFYLPLDSEVITSRDVLDFFKQAFQNSDSPQMSGIEVKPNSWGHSDDKTGMHRLIIKDGSGAHTEFMVLTEIDSEVFGPTGDNRDNWLRVRLGNPKPSLSAALTELTQEMDGWAATDSKAFSRLNTGESLYLLLQGDNNIKEFSRAEMVTSLNRLGDGSKKLKESAPDDELKSEIAKKLKVDSHITPEGKIVIPEKPAFVVDFSRGSPSM